MPNKAVTRAQIINDAERVVARSVEAVRGLGAAALGSPLGNAGAAPGGIDFTVAETAEDDSIVSTHAFMPYVDTLGDPCTLRVRGVKYNYLSS